MWNTCPASLPQVGILATVGAVQQLPVYRQPHVAVLSTGMPANPPAVLVAANVVAHFGKQRGSIRAHQLGSRQEHPHSYLSVCVSDVMCGPGDEVVEPTTKQLGPGQIRDANRSMLLAAAARAGCKVSCVVCALLVSKHT